MTYLEVIDIGVDFGGVRAVDSVSMSVDKGGRHAIVGPNGAGKTTFFNMIGGQVAPTRGSITLAGRRIERMPPRVRVRHGISRTFQITRLFPTLTVYQTILLAVIAPTSRKWSMRKAPETAGTVGKEVERFLDQWGLASYASERVGSLSYGTQRQIEIALALARKPELLLLDEPTAGLSIAERDLVIDQLRKVGDDVTIVLTEHDMDVVFGLARTMTVLERGNLVFSGTPTAAREHPKVRALYFEGD